MTLSGAQEPRHRAPARFVRVPGGSLPVHDHGTGPPVLLLHGISADHTEWERVGRDLAREFRVLMPDLLGRGASRPEAASSFTLDEETGRLEAVLESLAVHRPFVAGHSHGASLALALACRRPVAGLLLASPVTPWTRKPAPLAWLANGSVRRAVEPVLRTCRRPLTRYILTRRVYGANPPHVGDAVERYAAPYADPGRARALLRIFRDWEPGTLTGLRPPADLEIRVVSGGADRRIATADVERWAARLGAACTIVGGAGHGITEEEPALVAEMVRELAATVDK